MQLSRNKAPDGPSESMALMSKQNKMKCFKCGIRGHIKQNCTLRESKSKAEHVGKFCSKCNKKGHTLSNCWFAKRKGGGDTALMVSETYKNQWIVDSGATSHMCRDRESFTEFTPCNNKEVIIGNGVSLKVYP
ncbi:hypothetical protein M8J77_012034 [Diaphorina citri]|nr:hypothetical protein M8J77_012034 [Diaphorina citri]